MPQRSSDLVETYIARALGAGALGLVMLGLSGVMFRFQGESGGALASVLGVIAIGLLGYAVFAFVKSRSVSSFKLICPMCNATNGFSEAPQSDVSCVQCHRKIPIENGRVLPLHQVSCGACGESNWYSDHTRQLICESCGREIAIARATDGPVAQYAVSDDARPYEIVLVAYEQGSDELIEALQRLLGTDRARIRGIMTSLPSVLLSNVPRQKAEIVSDDLVALGAAVEARPLA